MPSLNPTVFVVDPDASVRAPLEAVIREEGWAAEGFASAGAFLARQPLPQPSCLVMALALPDLAGFDLLQRVVADRPGTPVIVLSGQHDIPSTVRAMKAGAAEVLAMPPADEVLLAAIGHAIARSRAVLEHEAELAELRERHASLSSRERQVMARVVAGHLNKQIAAALGISEITVKAHRGRVMRKMQAMSLAELVTMALTLDLPLTPSTTAPPATLWALSYRLTSVARGGASVQCPAGVGCTEPGRDGLRLRPAFRDDDGGRRWGAHGTQTANGQFRSLQVAHPASHGVGRF